MKKLFGKNKGEEHNFWMSYTDLMSGFLIVFIIGCIISAKYNTYVSDTDIVIPRDSLNSYVPKTHVVILRDSLDSMQYVPYTHVVIHKDSLLPPNNPYSAAYNTYVSDTEVVIPRDRLITVESDITRLNDSLRKMTSKYALLELEYQQFKRIRESVKQIDPLYFQYDSSFDRHTLHNVSVSFNRESANIQDISAVDRNKLLDVGRSILTFVDSAVSINANIKYLLIIEGQSSRDNYYTDEYRNNDVLSYRRALSLKNYWSRNNLRFDDGKCEIIISGSGQSSSFRLTPDVPKNRNNQRFVIHIIPKIGNIQ